MTTVTNRTHLDWDDDEFHLDQLPQMVIKIMEHVEKIKELSGIEKKELVIQKILDIASDEDNVVVNLLVPQMIDALIEVDGKGLKLNQDVTHDLKIMIRGFMDVCKDILNKCGC